jgi:hypothetical protein
MGDINARVACGGVNHRDLRPVRGRESPLYNRQGVAQTMVCGYTPE